MKRMKVSEAVTASTPNNKVTLEVSYWPYERYESTRKKKVRVNGKDLLDALKKMTDHMLLYLDRDEIEEEEMTPEDVIKRIEGENGDGCDFIEYIKDLSNNKFLLDWRGQFEEDEDQEW